MDNLVNSELSTILLKLLLIGIVGAIYSCLEIIENYPQNIKLALFNTSAWGLLALNFVSPIGVSFLLLLITDFDSSLVFGIGLSLPFSIRSDSYNHGTNKSVIETDLLKNASSEDLKHFLSKVRNVYLAIQFNFYDGIDCYLEDEKNKLIDKIIEKYDLQALKEKINAKIIDSNDQKRREKLRDKVTKIEQEYDKNYQHRYFANLYENNCTSKELKSLKNKNKSRNY